MSPLTHDQKKFLLRLARQSLEAVVCGVWLETPDIPDPIKTPANAFVTLHARENLRGCVGFVLAAKPLYQAVMEAAAAAALEDDRFSPVTPAELSELTVEISVLSSFQPVRPEEIRVGIHGLLVTRDRARGLLLPQVAKERRWTALEFLEATCRKAGLPPSAWRSGVRIEAFTAEVFSEYSLVGDELQR